jgi:hypothetical protein
MIRFSHFFLGLCLPVDPQVEIGLEREGPVRIGIVPLGCMRGYTLLNLRVFK